MIASARVFLRLPGPCARGRGTPRAPRRGTSAPDHVLPGHRYFHRGTYSISMPMQSAQAHEC